MGDSAGPTEHRPELSRHELPESRLFLQVHEQVREARVRPRLIELANLPSTLLVGQFEDAQQLLACPWGEEGQGHVHALVEGVGVHRLGIGTLRAKLKKSTASASCDETAAGATGFATSSWPGNLPVPHDRGA